MKFNLDDPKLDRKPTKPPSIKVTTFTSFEKTDFQNIVISPLKKPHHEIPLPQTNSILDESMLSDTSDNSLHPDSARMSSL